MGLIFRLSNVLVLPFWAVMILLPRVGTLSCL